MNALRDYGTGSWDGGDPDCDHDQRRRERDPDSKQATNAGSARDGVSGEACRKCGARRVDQQIGLEPTPDEWVAELVAVFRECRRVLRPHGTLWIECGDSYNSGTAATRNPTTTAEHGRWENGDLQQRVDVAGLKPKDLLGTPWLLAFALRADGWWLRQAIVWHKPNAMPESVTDRCTTAHSYVFLLSKSPRYWFDGDAIAEPAAWERWGDQTTSKHNGTQTSAGWIQPQTKEGLRSRGLTGGSYSPPGQTNHSGANPDAAIGAAKNPRSVWTIPTRGYPGAHFATFPEELVRRIVLAGCPAEVCSKCGSPVLPSSNGIRSVTTAPQDLPGVRNDLSAPAPGNPLLLEEVQLGENGQSARQQQGLVPEHEGLHIAPDAESSSVESRGLRAPASTGDVGTSWPTIDKQRGRPSQEWDQRRQPDRKPRGHAEASSRSELESGEGQNGSMSALWGTVPVARSCGQCGSDLDALGATTPGTILDCFGGAGTTGLVARRHGRHAILIELNGDYCRMAAERTQQLSVLAEETL